MQIPYSAVLRIPDKLTRMELQEFIVGEESRDHYMCEFHTERRKECQKHGVKRSDICFSRSRT